jgi:hypothetical protein
MESGANIPQKNLIGLAPIHTTPEMILALIHLRPIIFLQSRAENK